MNSRIAVFCCFAIVILQGIAMMVLTGVHNDQLKAQTAIHNAQLLAQAERFNAQLKSQAEAFNAQLLAREAGVPGK
jgi:hypothetical protein